MSAVNMLCIVLVLICISVNIKATCRVHENGAHATCSEVTDAAIWGTKQWKFFDVDVGNKNKFTTLKTNNFRATPNLESIKLFGVVNHIEDGAFNGLQKLDFLQLYKNQISKISVKMFKNLPIRHLSLHQTGVGQLAPGCFRTLANLSILAIRENNLPKITAGVFNNLNLRELLLPSNGISIIEDGAFNNMKKLVVLNLNGNQLSTFESKSLLTYSPSLTELWLLNNILTEINNDMFFGLPNLEIINLSFNRIVEVKDNSFSDVKKLQILVMMNNLVQELNPGILPAQGLSSVKRVYLQNNQLTFLSSGVLIRLPNLNTIALGGNPWQCPCLYHLISWSSNKNISRTCDREYFRGLRPMCIVSLTSPVDCEYDVLNTRDLVQIYSEAISEYTELPICLL